MGGGRIAAWQLLISRSDPATPDTDPAIGMTRIYLRV
jgi:hypothetical protein